jgi:peptidoglycan/LPS O-acetylase OafA/YrhL
MGKKYIYSIEAIRGFTALYVLLGHIVLLYHPQDLLPRFGTLIKILFSYGHQAVILFFIVSGFSIHYSTIINKRNVLENKKEYYFSRWKRIYPLFFMSLVFSLIVFFVAGLQAENNRLFLSFLFLTDISKGSIVDPIPSNFPIWSLSYELIYYIFYPFLWFFISNYSILKIFIFSIIISLVAFFVSEIGYPNHLTNVFQYFWTWVAGVFLVEFKLKNIKVSGTFLKGLIIFSMALMLTLENVFVLRDWFWAIFFVLIFISFLSKDLILSNKNKLINFLFGSIGISIAFAVTYIETAVFHPILLKYVLFGIFFLLIFFLFIPIVYFQNLLRLFLRPFVYMGSFSYALYIFHWPFIILIQYYFMDYVKLNIFFMLTLIFINVLLILYISWFLEVKFQPRIAKYLSKLYLKL